MRCVEVRRDERQVVIDIIPLRLEIDHIEISHALCLDEGLNGPCRYGKDRSLYRSPFRIQTSISDHVQCPFSPNPVCFSDLLYFDRGRIDEDLGHRTQDTWSAAMTSLLIVGAGPTGLTAAVELARRGLIARIIDKKSDPLPLSRAVGINAHSLTLLEASGVAERLLAAGIVILLDKAAHVRW